MRVAEKPIALLTIRGAGRMSDKRRASIAEWLREHANEFEKRGASYTDKTFTGRYFS